MFSVNRGVLTCQFDGQQIHRYDSDHRGDSLVRLMAHYGGPQAYLVSMGARSGSVGPYLWERLDDADRSPEDPPLWEVLFSALYQTVEEEDGLLVRAVERRQEALVAHTPFITLDHEAMLGWLSSYLDCAYYQTYLSAQTVTADTLTDQSSLHHCTLDAPGLSCPPPTGVRRDQGLCDRRH